MGNDEFDCSYLCTHNVYKVHTIGQFCTIVFLKFIISKLSNGSPKLVKDNNLRQCLIGFDEEFPIVGVWKEDNATGFII